VHDRLVGQVVVRHVVVLQRRNGLAVEHVAGPPLVQLALPVATTKVAMQLPSRFTETRIESMIRSAPSSSATAATGMAPWPIAATVADRARNDEPGTPAIPLEVSIRTSTAVPVVAREQPPWSG